VRIESRNFDDLRPLRGATIRRECLLDNLARLLGLDLYIEAFKRR